MNNENGNGKKNEAGSDEHEKMDRTSVGLRNALFDEIDALRGGRSNPARARALAMLANTALASVEVEIEYHKYVSDIQQHNGSASVGYLELGTKPVALAEKENKE